MNRICFGVRMTVDFPFGGLVLHLDHMTEKPLIKAIVQVINAYNKFLLSKYWGTGKHVGRPHFIRTSSRGHHCLPESMTSQARYAHRIVPCGNYSINSMS